MTTTTPVPASDELLQQRRLEVSKNTAYTGLDYVHYISGNSTTPPKLELYFIKKVTGVSGTMVPKMTDANVQITVKVPGNSNSTFVPQTFNITTAKTDTNTYNILLNSTGIISATDNTIYTLSLIDAANNTVPLSTVDPFLFQADFSISANNSTDFDALQPTAAVTSLPIEQSPEIDYLSRDYLSFRHLMLSRLSLLIPDWQANNEADLGSVIVEILAYAADYLSYYQDAIATEAYLGTARSRISVKRHARLLDYIMSEGCNARVWVHVDVANSVTLPSQTQLLSRGSLKPAAIESTSKTHETLINDPTIIQFATMYESTLYPAHNEINFYTWGSKEFSLAVGATSATLKGNLPDLAKGDVLVFTQVKNTDTGTTDNVDQQLRWAVRLETVKSTITSGQHTENLQDPLFAVDITEITWSAQDALPFELVIASIIDGEAVTEISKAYGNMILADQGSQRIENEPLIPDKAPKQGVYRPTLSQSNITFYQPFDNDTAKNQGASQATQQDPRATIPDVALTDNSGQLWNAQQDLLNSDYASTDFVLEIQDNRQAFIRFGDGTFGKLPSPSDTFNATYRVSNGSAGNIGAESLAYIAVNNTKVMTTDILGISNPLPAQGGIDPEPIEQVKLYAPKAFQQQIQRCVTVDDYIRVTQQYNQATNQSDNINSVNAVLRWTGSWHTVFIAVALKGGADFDDTFKQDLLDYLSTYKLIGHDLEIIQPQWVPLEIVLPVTVQTGYSENMVLQDLMQRFSSTLPSGFFYPDNFVFGQPIYLSEIVAAIMETPGVAYVDTISKNAKFQRFGENGLAAQKININPLEIVQVNTNTSGQGSIQFIM